MKTPGRGFTIIELVVMLSISLIVVYMASNLYTFTGKRFSKVLGDVNREELRKWARSGLDCPRTKRISGFFQKCSSIAPDVVPCDQNQSPWYIDLANKNGQVIVSRNLGSSINTRQGYKLRARCVSKDGVPNVIIEGLKGGSCATEKWQDLFSAGAGIDLTPCRNSNNADTVAMYSYQNGRFLVSNVNGRSVPDFTFTFRPWSSAYPVAGDWNADGTTTIGVMEKGDCVAGQAKPCFFLQNFYQYPVNGDERFADVTILYGPEWQGVLPIAGKWVAGQTQSTIGYYFFDSNLGEFHLRKNNVPTEDPNFVHDELVFKINDSSIDYYHTKPIAGDWDGDGVTEVALFSPSSRAFYLKYDNSEGPADKIFEFPTGINCSQCKYTPIAGDWNGDGITTVGVYEESSHTFYLRNENNPGAADLQFSWSDANDFFLPVVGNWDSLNL